MLKLKSLQFLCFASCLALPLLAVAGGPDRMAVPEPAATGHILLGATLGDFKQVNQGTAYGVLGNSAFDSAQGPLIRIPIDYRFGWGVHLGYLFSNSNDITSSFFAHDGRDNGEIIPGVGQNVKLTKLPANFNIRFAGQAFSVVTYKTHLYQLAFGHRIYFSQNAFMLHPFFGVGFAKVWLDQQITYDALDGNPGRQGLMSETSGFNGAGPLVGFDFAWRLGRYFSVIGRALWNGIIANVKQDYRMFLNGSSANPFFVQGQSDTDVISLLSFEAGLAVDFMMNHHDVQIMLGYRATEFINGVARSAFPDGNADNFMTNVMEDASFQGPFVRASLAFGGPDRMALSGLGTGHILLGATFGGFKQANQGTAYGVLGDSAFSNAQGSLIRIPIDYHFGWGLHLGYLFSNNNDINFSFFTHDGRDNGEIIPGAGQHVKITKAPANFRVRNADRAFSVVAYKTHLYQLAFGHRIYFSPNAFMLHPFFGVGFAKVWLDQQIT